MSAAEIADVPEGVVTVTSTIPAVYAGLVAVIEVALTTVTPVAAVVPKFTAVAPRRFVPEIVTEVPPAVEPDIGVMPVTVGEVVALLFTKTVIVPVFLFAALSYAVTVST